MARRDKTRRKREVRADRALDALPALSTLTELPTFDELSASSRQEEAFEQACARAVDAGASRDELALGCVVRLDRGYPAVLCHDETFRAEFATRMTKGSFSKVAVGDSVCARRPEGHEMGRIEEILPRESDIARWKGGARGGRRSAPSTLPATPGAFSACSAGRRRA